MAGGSILQEVLNVGDEIEVRPGQHRLHADGRQGACIACAPRAELSSRRWRCARGSQGARGAELSSRRPRCAGCSMRPRCAGSSRRWRGAGSSGRWRCARCSRRWRCARGSQGARGAELSSRRPRCAGCSMRPRCAGGAQGASCASHTRARFSLALAYVVLATYFLFPSAHHPPILWRRGLRSFWANEVVTYFAPRFC